jgi:hypothetical protein
MPAPRRRAPAGAGGPRTVPRGPQRGGESVTGSDQESQRSAKEWRRVSRSGDQTGCQGGDAMTERQSEEQLLPPAAMSWRSSRRPPAATVGRTDTSGNSRGVGVSPKPRGSLGSSVSCTPPSGPMQRRTGQRDPGVMGLSDTPHLRSVGSGPGTLCPLPSRRDRAAIRAGQITDVGGARQHHDRPRSK